MDAWIALLCFAVVAVIVVLDTRWSFGDEDRVEPPTGGSSADSGPNVPTSS